MPDIDTVPADEAARAEVAGDARLSAVLQVWLQAAGEHGVPRPRDMSALTLPPQVLPFITLLDAIDGGRSFRIRLVGTASVSAAGRDFTGRMLHEAMTGFLLQAAENRYRAAIAYRRPILASSEYSMPDGSSIRNLIMAMPLSSDGDVVDRIIGVFSPKSDWLVRQALRTQDALAYRKPVRSLMVF